MIYLAPSRLGSKLTLPVGCPALTSGPPDPTATSAVWQSRTITPPLALNPSPEPQVLSASTDPKSVDIDLDSQRLVARQGEIFFLESPLSSGYWTPTPTGEFTVTSQVLSATFSGGNRLNRSYYHLPNVPFVQYFSGDFALHGAYWLDKFGVPSTSGCIAVPVDIAQKLYSWHPDKIIIHD